VDLGDRGREVLGRGAARDEPVDAVFHELDRGVVLARRHDDRRRAGRRLDHDEPVALALGGEHEA
jgi:hypothetical protein